MAPGGTRFLSDLSKGRRHGITQVLVGQAGDRRTFHSGCLESRRSRSAAQTPEWGELSSQHNLAAMATPLQRKRYPDAPGWGQPSVRLPTRQCGKGQGVRWRILQPSWDLAACPFLQMKAVQGRALTPDDGSGIFSR
uniref:Uncharacterized protein n=1 Tax=Sphaerodactylus townsendi TaxID=933632 RepID=A0ACB8EK17_9SAUR